MVAKMASFLLFLQRRYKFCSLNVGKAHNSYVGKNKTQVLIQTIQVYRVGKADWNETDIWVTMPHFDVYVFEVEAVSQHSLDHWVTELDWDPMIFKNQPIIAKSDSVLKFFRTGIILYVFSMKYFPLATRYRNSQANQQ